MMALNKIEQKRLELIAKNHQITNLSAADYTGAGLIFPATILDKAYLDFSNKSDYSPDTKGYLKARKAVALFYKKRGFTANAQQIFLTSGTSESYFHLFQMLCNKDDEVLFPQPNYPLFDYIAHMAGIKIKHYQLDDQNYWQINIKNLEKQITARTKAIVLISPNNPTGGVLNQENLTAIHSLAVKFGLSIIVDEVFSEYIFDNKKFPRMAANFPDSPIAIFTLNGLSKIYALPGLKLGWIIASGNYSKNMLEQLELSIDTFLAGSDIIQKMAVEIIESGEPTLAGFKEIVESKLALATKIIESHPKHNQVDFIKPAGGFYLFLKINSSEQEEAIAIKLLEKAHIFVHPGYFYDVKVGKYFLICFLQSDQILQAALTKFMDLI